MNMVFHSPSQCEVKEITEFCGKAVGEMSTAKDITVEVSSYDSSRDILEARDFSAELKTPISREESVSDAEQTNNVATGILVTKNPAVQKHDTNFVADDNSAKIGISPTRKMSPKNGEKHISEKDASSLLISTKFSAKEREHIEQQNIPNEETKASETSHDNKKGFILLNDHNGTEYLLPWQICCTWKGMKYLLEHNLPLSEDERRELQEDRFELRGPKDAIILPQLWDTLLEPDWEVCLYLSSKPFEKYRCNESDSDDNDDSESDGNASKVETHEPREPVYEDKVQYTVDCYRKTYYDDHEFAQSYSYDSRVELRQMDMTSGTTPVLEEKQEVIFSRDRSAQNLSAEAVKNGKAEMLKLQPGDNVGKICLHVKSHFLLNAIRSVVKYTSEAPSGDDDSLKDGIFDYPFRDLFHHKDDLLEYKQHHCGAEGRHSEEYVTNLSRHLDILINYLYTQPNIDFREAEARWVKKVPTTAFGSFWLLMKPGSDVYVHDNGALNPYVVERVEGGVNERTVVPYSILVWNLAFNGSTINRQSKTVYVPVFDGEREISSLPIFPTRFKAKESELRSELITRGRKFLACSKGPMFMEYTGMGLKKPYKSYKRARVVIEHASRPWDYVNLGKDNRIEENEEIGTRARKPNCQCDGCESQHSEKEIYVPVTYSNYDHIVPEEVEELTEHQYLLCSSHMFGFILKDRVYDFLDLYNVDYPKIASDAVDKLVMKPESNKDTIKAIAKTYTDGDGQQKVSGVDFIQGKGEGQIILLHGPPGTGKTLTAESVAEFTKRPLLGITSADLGHEPVELERNLLKFFKNANDWDAIVLLDEADVYLERRSTNDLKRNSIVSIFLRALDYFQGILFLTTNRVGHFDEAFMSRIHVQIGYEALDNDARSQIWDNFFRKLRTDKENGGPEIRYEFEAKEFVKKSTDVTSLKWNGREIRNAFQTAVALAVFDARNADEKGGKAKATTIPEIKESHLRQVVSMSTAFREYMTSVHQGAEDSQMAYEYGIRDDRFGKGKEPSHQGGTGTKRT